MDTAEHWKRKTPVSLLENVFFGENNRRELGHRDPPERLCVVTWNTSKRDRARRIGQQGVVGGERPWPVAPGEPHPPNSPSQRNQDGGSCPALTYTNQRRGSPLNLD